MSKIDAASAEKCAIEAVLKEDAGDLQRSEELLEAALKNGRPAWVYALRGAMRARRGDLLGAREDLDRAARRDDSPWVHLERARLLRRLGRLPLSLKVLQKVAKAAPKSAEPHLTAAAIHFDQARYAKALGSLNRALMLEPGRPDACDQRARVFFILSDWRLAEKDLRQALDLAPDDPGLKERLAQTLIHGGQTAEARRELLHLKHRLGAPEFWMGYLRCRQRRYLDAERLFARAEDLGQDEDFRKKARFCRWVARLLKGRPEETVPRGKELTIIGLGYRYPYQIDVAALKALSRCETIFSNTADPAVVDFLGLFPAPRRATYFRDSKAQASLSAAEVLRSFQKMRRLVVVTRGHPVVFGQLALDLAKACARHGVACRVIGAVTTFDLLASLVPFKPTGSLGLQVRDSMDLKGVRPQTPVMVYRPLSKKSRGLERMLKRYPKSHLCYLLTGRGDGEQIMTVEARALRLGFEQAGHSSTMFVPAV